MADTRQPYTPAEMAQIIGEACTKCGGWGDAGDREPRGDCLRCAGSGMEPVDDGVYEIKDARTDKEWKTHAE